jgi:hypothetical protein
MRTMQALLLLASCIALSLGGCSTGARHFSDSQVGDDTEGGVGGADGGPLPFTEDPPSVYVAKVKNVLLGLPPTDQ